MPSNMRLSYVHVRPANTASTLYELQNASRALSMYSMAACCNDDADTTSGILRQVAVLALGPLTNLALALQLDPSFATNVVRTAPKLTPCTLHAWVVLRSTHAEAEFSFDSQQSQHLCACRQR